MVQHPVHHVARRRRRALKERTTRLLAAIAVACACTLGLGLAPAVTANADEVTTQTGPAAGETPRETFKRLLTLDGIPAEDRQRLNAKLAAISDDTLKAMTSLAAPDEAKNSLWAETARAAINPSDYQCGLSPLYAWLQSEVGPYGLVFDVFGWFGLDQLPVYDALLLDQEGKQFGYDGTDTHLLTSALKDLQSFWDIDGDAVQMVPLKGDVYSDPDRIAQIYIAVGLSEDEAHAVADLIVDLVKSTQIFRGGQHPYFSFNAFSFSPEGQDPPLDKLPRKILIGDGILQGFDAIGIDDKVAPRAILAHEYGHQVQFTHDLFDSDLPTEAERTRRSELMADSLATYFTVHARGEALNAARTLADQKTFYNVGDCSFASNNHHGTPLQRYRAAEWAASVVNGAGDQGHILPSREFAAMFDRQLPTLVAPDAN
jgi:hypothetical protein